MARVDAWAAAILVVAGLAAIFVVIPAQTGEGEAYGLPPAAYPTLGATVLTVCAGLLLIASIRPRGAERGDDSMPAGPVAWRHAGVVLAVLAASFVVIRYLGFLIGGSLTIAAFMVYMGSRSAIGVAAVSIATPVAIYLFFWQLFSIPLP